MLATPPNVLILHLQRLTFDIETCQNVKLNDKMEFSNVLNLKPYSYHEIMRKEGRLRPNEEREAEMQEIMGLPED